MRRRSAASLVLVGVAAALCAPPASTVSAREPTLPEVLDRAAKYVDALADPTRVLYCEERYKHTFIKFIVNLAGSGERIPQGGHEWVAEMAVVATPDDVTNGFPWIEFRDIVTLDGRPQRDGASRLGMLATQPFAAAGPEAMRITRDTAGTQFGRLERSLLLPRLTSVFLHAANQPRFIFGKGGDRTLQGVKTWEVKFKEQAVPTIITATGGGNAPSSGSFWIDPATGHVLASVLKNGDSSTLFDELTVMYTLDQATGLWLPATLSEKTTDAEESREIEGKGTFKNWRVAPRTAK